jgi:hypothetical protein
LHGAAEPGNGPALSLILMQRSIICRRRSLPTRVVKAILCDKYQIGGYR